MMTHILLASAAVVVLLALSSWAILERSRIKELQNPLEPVPLPEDWPKLFFRHHVFPIRFSELGDIVRFPVELREVMPYYFVNSGETRALSIDRGGVIEVSLTYWDSGEPVPSSHARVKLDDSRLPTHANVFCLDAELLRDDLVLTVTTKELAEKQPVE